MSFLTRRPGILVAGHLFRHSGRGAPPGIGHPAAWVCWSEDPGQSVTSDGSTEPGGSDFSEVVTTATTVFI